MYDVLHTDDVVLAQGSLNDLVASEGGPTPADLPVTSLVHQFSHGLEVGVATRDIQPLGNIPYIG